MNCGDICLVQYPFTDGAGAKVRPVLVVSANSHNAGEDVVVLPITGDPKKDERYCVAIDTDSPHFARSGLKFASAIKCTKPLTIAKRLLQKRLGSAHPDLLSEVRTYLAELFSITTT